MLFDIISLILIVIFAIIGIKTGAAKTICRFLSYVIAFVAAAFCSHFLAELVYNVFLKQTITDKITIVLNDSALHTAGEKATELFAGFPAFFTNTLNYFGVNEGRVLSLVESSAAGAIENLLMAPVVGIVSIVLFIILFFVLLFIVKKLLNLVAKLFRLPVIRIADSAVGLVIGLLEGVIVVYILAFALKLIIPLTGGDIFILNEAYVSKSLFFSLFYYGGFISFVQSFIYSFSNNL